MRRSTEAITDQSRRQAAFDEACRQFFFAVMYDNEIKPSEMSDKVRTTFRAAIAAENGLYAGFKDVYQEFWVATSEDTVPPEDPVQLAAHVRLTCPQCGGSMRWNGIDAYHCQTCHFATSDFAQLSPEEPKQATRTPVCAFPGCFVSTPPRQDYCAAHAQFEGPEGKPIYFCAWEDAGCCDQTVEQEGGLCPPHQEMAKPRPGEFGYQGALTREHICEHPGCTKGTAYDHHGHGYCSEHYFQIAWS